MGTAPLGKRARGIHPSGDGKLIFVALSGSPFAPTGVDGIGVFDVAQNKMLRKIPGGSDPEQFAIAQDGKLLFVSNEDAAGLSFVDPSNGQVLKTLATGTIPMGVGMKPMGMAITRDGTSLYVSTGRGKKVMVVETATGQIKYSFEVGDRPRGIALSPDEKLLFTANGPSNDISIVDLATRAVVKKVKVGNRPWGVTTIVQ